MDERPAVGHVNLDDNASWQVLDSQGLLAMGEDFPEQCREGLRIGDEAELGPEYAQVPDALVVVGMGGSAIGGDLFARMFEEALPVPVHVVRYYELPSFVGERTLVITCSYSGDTEEVLAAYDQAIARGARVIAITSGGKLEARSLGHHTALIKVPGGRPPRAAIGYMLMPLVSLATRLGLVPPIDRERQEMLELLEQQAASFRRQVPVAGNRAKQVARELHGHFPLVYATSPFLRPVAFRWQTELNENSKVLALSHELPELNHNEVVGWEQGLDLVVRPVFIFLATPHDHPRVQARVQITKELIGDRAPVHVELAAGESLPAQIVTAMYLGDMASLYLAFLNGVDPYLIKPINYLKQRLAEIG